MTLLGALAPPFDHELALLVAGERALVKAEFADEERLARAHSLGLCVWLGDDRYGLSARGPDVEPGAADAATAFLAWDAATARRAAELDRAERHARGAERLGAMRELGALLGYPTCCVEAWLCDREQTESSVFGRLLAGAPREGLPRGNNLFVLDHMVISHFPCDLACAASAAVGERALRLLDAGDPSRAGAVATLLAAPITVWDRLRFVVEHPEAGAVCASALTEAARVLEHPAFLAFEAALPGRPPGGARFVFDAVL